MQGDLAQLIADAKDVEEADSFVNAAGTAFYPEGILVGATITLDTAGTAVLVENDLYSLQEALPARFQAGSSWLANLVWIHKAARLVAQADASEPRMFNDAGDRLLRRPITEASGMPSALTSGTAIFALGDFKRSVVIADRLGLTLEVIPHLFGSSRRPTGERGIFAHWQNTSKVIIPEGIRVLTLL